MTKHDRTKSFQESIPALLEEITHDYGAVRIDRKPLSAGSWYVASSVGCSGSGDSIGGAVRALHRRVTTTDLPSEANKDDGPNGSRRYCLARIAVLVELIVMVFAGLVFVVADSVVSTFQAVLVAGIILVCGTALNLVLWWTEP